MWLCREEHTTLRAELHDLKDCQVKFLSFSLLAAGTIFGAIGALWDPAPSLAGFLFLAPLVFLIPCWWVFFDKALTISRIVGYFLILEQLLLRKPQESLVFCGWENALERHRELQKTKALSRTAIPKKGLIAVFALRGSHRYWALVYYAFLGVSVLCLALSIVAGLTAAEANQTMQDRHMCLWIVLWAVGFLIVGASALVNGRLLTHLVCGMYSYDTNALLWAKVLSGPCPKFSPAGEPRDVPSGDESVGH